MSPEPGRPLRVAQVSGHLDPAGRGPEELLRAWPTLLDVAEAAAEAGVEVTVYQACRRETSLRRRGVDVRFVSPRLGGGRLEVAWRLARRIRSGTFDAVHLQGLGFPLLARLLTRPGGPPVLVQDHGDRIPPLHRRPLVRWGLSRVDAVAFTAAPQARPFRQARILPVDAVIHEVLESSSAFRPGSRREARERTGVRGDPAVLWVGRLDANKDPLTALDAAAMAAPEVPDLQLWCCFTDAPLLDAVRGRIRSDPRLRGRVNLLGGVPHRTVEALCRAADFFLSTSRREGSGYALLEALACGLPPAVSRIPSFVRITGGEVGALASPGHPEAFAAALVQMTQERGEAERLRVRRYFEEHLSFEAVGRELRRAYEATAGRPAWSEGRKSTAVRVSGDAGATP